jgi:ribonuclease P protein component
LGLVVSKKFARTSVRRNLIKRQTRMLFDGWQRGRMVAAGGPAVAAWDVVLKLNANVVALARAAQYGEIAGLMRALPQA